MKIREIKGRTRRAVSDHPRDRVWAMTSTETKSRRVQSRKFNRSNNRYKISVHFNILYSAEITLVRRIRRSSRRFTVLSCTLQKVSEPLQNTFFMVF